MHSKHALSLNVRLYFLLGPMLFGFILFGGYSVMDLRSHIMEEKKLAIQAIVDTGMGVIQQQAGKFIIHFGKDDEQARGHCSQHSKQR
jgi:hypothetical protein